MKIIGVCGSSGSGKSTVCAILSEMKIPVLDCDRIYHDLISWESPCLLAISERFGNNVIRGGALDRDALRKIVFEDDAALRDLNAITHRFVLDALRERLDHFQELGEPYAVIDAPMFFEAKLESWCDTVCAVIADKKDQVERICARDRISEKDALKRIAKQIDPSVLREKCDYIIENKCDLENLRNECIRLLEYVDSKEQPSK